jgi:hypothetical protein
MQKKNYVNCVDIIVALVSYYLGRFPKINLDSVDFFNITIGYIKNRINEIFVRFLHLNHHGRRGESNNI